jgi:hypothetical protein
MARTAPPPPGITYCLTCDQPFVKGRPIKSWASFDGRRVGVCARCVKRASDPFFLGPLMLKILEIPGRQPLRGRTKHVVMLDVAADWSDEPEARDARGT